MFISIIVHSIFTAAARWAEVVIMSNLIYIYMCVCVCVCVCARHFFQESIQIVRTTRVVSMIARRVRIVRVKRVIGMVNIPRKVSIPRTVKIC